MNEINTQTLDNIERLAAAAQRLSDKLQLLMLCDTDQLDTVGSMVARKLDAFNAALYDVNLHATPIYLGVRDYVRQKREISK
jgi:hypothetical protein